MFVVSCAERLIDQPTQHSEDEILKRIINDLVGDVSNIQLNSATHLQFRLLVVERIGTELEQEVFFYSRIEPLPDRDAS